MVDTEHVFETMASTEFVMHLHGFCNCRSFVDARDITEQKVKGIQSSERPPQTLFNMDNIHLSSPVSPWLLSSKWHGHCPAISSFLMQS